MVTAPGRPAAVLSHSARFGFYCIGVAPPRYSRSQIEQNETVRQQADNAIKQTMSTSPSKDAELLMDATNWHTVPDMHVSLVSLHLEAWHTSKKHHLHA